MSERRISETLLEKTLLEAATALAAHLRALPAAESGWRTMDSAPRDGTWILIYYSDVCMPTFAFWAGGHWQSNRLGTNTPRFWRYPPAPPEAAAPAEPAASDAEKERFRLALHQIAYEASMSNKDTIVKHARDALSRQGEGE